MTDHHHRRRLSKRAAQLERIAREHRAVPDRDQLLSRIREHGEYLLFLRQHGQGTALSEMRTADLVAECMAAIPTPSIEILTEIEARGERRRDLPRDEKTWLWLIFGHAVLAEARRTGTAVDLRAEQERFLAS